MKKKLDQQVNTKKIGSEKIDEPFTNYEIEIKQKSNSKTDEPDIHSSKIHTRDKPSVRKPSNKLIENWYSLNFDKTKQVKISTYDTSKEIRLYSNGIPYSLWAKGRAYVGCGIDAVNSFMGWFNENITRKDIIKYVTTHDPLVVNNIFSTPAEVGNGLANLMKNKSSINSFETIRYSFNAKNYKADKVNYSSKEEVHIAIIKTIQAHLEAGTPLIALINNGNHWVTIVGIVVEYTSSSKRYISVDHTTITYIDMTAGTTRVNVKYRNMKIFPWPYDAGRDIAHSICSSYVDGMLITLKNYLSLKYSERITPPYVVSITTGDATNAGTDSNIFVKLYGEYGESDEVKISSICEDYERSSSNHIGRTDGIIKTNKYLGKIDRIKVRSDGSGDNSDWLLKDVIVTKENNDLNEVFKFTGGTWFEKNRRLTKIITENSHKAKFKISLKTGDVKDAGTNSTIFIKIFAESKTSYSISSTLQNIDNLYLDDNERNTTLIYYIYAPKEMLDIEKVYIESDNKGSKPEWFLEKITVEKIDQKTGKNLSAYHFTVKEWLSKENPHITIYEDLIKENYKIKIKTGDIPSAGTNSNVYIKLYGDRITDFIKLDKLSHNDFERGKTDLYNISNIDIREIEKIEIKHDNTGDNPSWFLEKVEIIKQNKQYNFTAQRWLSKGPGLSLNTIINEDLEQFKYLITIKTANKKNAGTNANIYIKLYGEKQSQTFLQRIDNPVVDDFEQNQTGIYIIYSNEKLGEINKIYIESDNSGDNADWEIERTSIVLESEPNIKYLFNESHRFYDKSRSKFFIRSK